MTEGAGPGTPPNEDKMQLVRDVIVQTTCETRVPDEVFQAEPPLRQRVTLGDGLWVGPGLGCETVDAVLSACSPAGLNWAPTRVFGYHYCFVREQHLPSPAPVTWDHDRRLQDCIDLSRLVHQTTISTHFAARLIYSDNSLSMIVPGPTQGFGSYAWVCRQDWRNWLTIQEACELGRLLAAYNRDKLPRRLRRAMWHFLYACLTAEPHPRLTLLVTGLEALVNTSGRNVKARFSKRLTQIGSEIGVSTSEGALKEAFKCRSSLAHGQAFECDDTRFREMCEMLEDLLRKTIKRAILEEDFANRFQSEETIDLEYPVA